jgi:signal transduction histidine kinase
LNTIIENHRRLWVGLWVSALALIALTWVLALAVVQDGREKELASAQQTLFNLSRVSQEHAVRTLRAADQAIRFIEARYLAVGQQLNLAELVEQGVIDVSLFPQVGVIDAQGIYILSNRPIAQRLDLSDREHFKVHVATDTGELFVSKPVLGRATGQWSIQLTRRITRSDGSFGGVVVVSIAVDYFNRFYRDLQMGDHGLMALYGLDGIARARKAGPTEAAGTQALQSQAFERIRQGELQGFYTTRSVVDGVERVFHYRKVTDYPLVVFAAQDTAHVFESHNSTQKTLWLGAAVVTALILGLAVALTRYLYQLRRTFRIREHTQRQVEEHNEQLNTIFQLSPDGFVSFDHDQRIRFVSPAVAQLTGQDQPLLGLSESAFSSWLAGLCAPSTPFAGVAALRAQTQADAAAEMPVIELAKPLRRMLKVGFRASNSSQVSQIVYLRDVTHEVEVDQMKSEFLATAAHELRTPMASILGYSEILLDAEFSSTDLHEFLITIHTNSKLMAKILEDLLDLARIEARRDQDFSYHPVQLNTLLPALVQDFQPPWGRSAPQLALPEEPVWLMADADKLRQALTNVLSNAYKYSPQGGPVDIKTSVQRLHALPAQVCIEIIDRGIGMTPAQLARICERFYRADASGKTLGTGLGMSIAKEIVELHQGKLSFESTPEQGTCVRMCLPLMLDQPRATPIPDTNGQALPPNEPSP